MCCKIDIEQKISILEMIMLHMDLKHLHLSRYHRSGQNGVLRKSIISDAAFDTKLAKNRF